MSPCGPGAGRGAVLVAGRARARPGDPPRRAPGDDDVDLLWRRELGDQRVGGRRGLSVPQVRTLAVVVVRQEAAVGHTHTLVEMTREPLSGPAVVRERARVQIGRASCRERV